MENIQSLLFDKNYYTKTQVNQWLRRHNITPIKHIHITKNFYRSRLKTTNYNKYCYRIGYLENTHIRAIFEFEK